MIKDIFFAFLLALFCVFAIVMYTSCTTSHSFSINADSIEKADIHYSDSTGVSNFLKK